MNVTPAPTSPRERTLLSDDWRFFKYAPDEPTDTLIYDVRPDVHNDSDTRAADARPTEAVYLETAQPILKPWILPTGNPFIRDPGKRHARPAGNPGGDFPFVQADFDDSTWESVRVPHDWAIQGPFYTSDNAPVGGSMGRLPSPGVAWYRKKLTIPASDTGHSFFLDVDGAMSYAMVWLDGHLVGGWPYGYASWRVDLTPYIIPGGKNVLAIRLDNPPESSRWYPGGGLYRNVWLVKTAPVHIAYWGTRIVTPQVSPLSATVEIEVTVDNDSPTTAAMTISTSIYTLDAEGQQTGDAVAYLEPMENAIPAKGSATVKCAVNLEKPRLWGPLPTQRPNRYVAVTTVSQQDMVCDRYETVFGIRSVRFEPGTGIWVNGERIAIRGVNLHHDLGALGAAFHTRAAERQLELLQEMGCNAIRMSHNPPAPELLDLTDRMGFLVIDEIFDAWEMKKPPLDFHLLFSDWKEPDLRALIRRDRNHPSVILWSVGNEVGEQYTGNDGAAVAQYLHDLAQDEDATRPTTAAMNYAKPNMPLPGVLDVVSLNYQGEGIRDTPAHAGLNGIRTPPQYPAFREKFPGKVLLSSETAAAVSTRGEYLFPVAEGVSAPVRDGRGGDPQNHFVSAYELYAVDFGSAADKVFATQDQYPYVAGEFVWTGWDYLGEPTPYYTARSSYFGIIDLAGFKKDRFYLYQSRWRPDLPLAHLLPHWTWPERLGQITPVHVFTSGDEAELFLNNKSLGRKRKQPEEYRLRWDEVCYEPGELKVIAYKQGKEWATDVRQTVGAPFALAAEADRDLVRADGFDLSFVTARVLDKAGRLVPRAKNQIRFTIEGPGEIVATDNGDPTNFVPFPSHERAAFNGLCLAIVRTRANQSGEITIRAASEALHSATVSLQSMTDTTKQQK